MWRAARGWAGRRQCARPASHARQAWPVATGLPARHGWATSWAMAPQCQLGNQSPKLSQSTLHPIDSRAGRRQSGGRLHLWGSAPGWRPACIAAQHGRQIKNCTNATGHLHHSLQRKPGAPIVAVANDAHVVGSALQLAVADQCLHRLEQGRWGTGVHVRAVGPAGRAWAALGKATSHSPQQTQKTSVRAPAPNESVRCPRGST